MRVALLVPALALLLPVRTALAAPLAPTAASAHPSLDSSPDGEPGELLLAGRGPPVMCDPNAKSPEFCPGNIPCPKCGKPACPCPTGPAPPPAPPAPPGPAPPTPPTPAPPAPPPGPPQPPPPPPPAGQEPYGTRLIPAYFPSRAAP